MSVIEAPIPTKDPLEDIPTLPEEPKKLSPAKQLIKNALDVWYKCGWAKHHLKNIYGGVCAVGALDMAYYGRTSDLFCPSDGRQNSVYAEAASLINNEIVKKGFDKRSGLANITEFNDSRVSFSEIRDVFERALKS